jgi:hypothetical protein
MVIWVSSTASLYFSVPQPKPGLISIISHGMASWQTTVMMMVEAARVAMASAARMSAFSSPSRCSDLA